MDKSEKGDKEFEYLLHRADSLVERVQNRLELSTLRLEEDYLKGKVGFHAHLVAKNSLFGSKSVEYCTIFERDAQSPLSAGGLHVERISFARIGIPELIEDGSGIYRKPVFVVNIEGVQQPEQIIPSLVRLQLLDERESVGMRSLYFSFESGWKFLSCFGDRKGGISAASIAVLDDKRTNQVIKSRAQVVQNISCNNSPHARKGLAASRRHNILASYNLFFNNEGVRVEFTKRVNRGLKFSEVFFGPFDL